MCAHTAPAPAAALHGWADPCLFVCSKADLPEASRQPPVALLSSAAAPLPAPTPFLLCRLQPSPAGIFTQLATMATFLWVPACSPPCVRWTLSQEGGVAVVSDCSGQQALARPHRPPLLWAVCRSGAQAGAAAGLRGSWETGVQQVSSLADTLSTGSCRPLFCPVALGAMGAAVAAILSFSLYRVLGEEPMSPGPAVLSQGAGAGLPQSPPLLRTAPHCPAPPTGRAWLPATGAGRGLPLDIRCWRDRGV